MEQAVTKSQGCTEDDRVHGMPSPSSIVYSDQIGTATTGLHSSTSAMLGMLLTDVIGASHTYLLHLVRSLSTSSLCSTKASTAGASTAQSRSPCISPVISHYNHETLIHVRRTCALPASNTGKDRPVISRDLQQWLYAIVFSRCKSVI